jgi:hypothetical protein
MNLIKNFKEKFDDLLQTPKTIETIEITRDYFLLIQFSIKTTKVLYAGEAEVKETFEYKVRVMRRYGEASQLAFPNKDNHSETERSDDVAKLSRPIASGETAHTTALKYCGLNFWRKELCRRRSGVLLCMIR